MTNKKFDVFGVGNALVDILAQVEDSFITDCGLDKCGMTLMETDRQAEILTKLEHQNLKLASGGSAANTMVAITQSGGTACYTGKVTADTHGVFYKKDLEEVDVEFYVNMADEASLPTGTSVILTTPDAERTMCTHLGISTTLSKQDVDTDRLSNSKFCYVEGYLWTSDNQRAACIETFEQAKKLGVQTAFTFSDLFLVDLFKDDFRTLVDEFIDVVFCNADEARKFFEVEDINECARQLSELCELGFLTDSGNGCFVTDSSGVHHVPGFRVNAIDTVGAGDAFAGGVLFGLTNGMNPYESAKWGNYFASRVVEIIGPRVEGMSMKEHLPSVV